MIQTAGRLEATREWAELFVEFARAIAALLRCRAVEAVFKISVPSAIGDASVPSGGQPRRATL